MSDDVQKLLRYIISEYNLDKEFRTSGCFHTDVCNCHDCQYIRVWLYLPFYRKLLAKLFL